MLGKKEAKRGWVKAGFLRVLGLSLPNAGSRAGFTFSLYCDGGIDGAFTFPQLP